MFRPALSRFARVCRKLACPPILSDARASDARKARLSLEALDGRIVPATCFWLGTEDTDAGNPDNWSDGIAPVAWDTVRFTGDYNVACVGLSGNFEVMSLASGYTATVTLGGSVNTTEFSISDGTVVAPGSLSSYCAYMYGGVLDVQSSGSFWQLDMYGGSATIDGAATFTNLLTVSGGSSIELASGGTAGMINVQGGTLTLGDALTTGVFYLSGGEVKQASATTLTVTGIRDEWSGIGFTWTGGILNSIPNDATVNILSDGSIVLPGIGNSLTTGSTLSFGSSGGEKNTTISGGGELILNGTNANAISVRQDAKVLRPTQVATPGAVKGVNNQNKTLTIDAGGAWGYIGQGTDDLGLAVTNLGGHFFLGNEGLGNLGLSQVTLNLTANAAVVGYSQNSNNNNSAGLTIMSGCVLDASGTKGVEINGGTVWLIGNGGLTAAQQVATIKGTFTMNDGVIAFLTPTLTSDNLTAWGNFKVEGDVNWSGGQYNPGLDCAASSVANTANRWIITGTLTIDSSRPVKPIISPIPQFLPAGQQASGTWDVITANQVAFKNPGNQPNIIPGWVLLPVVQPGGATTGYKVNK